MAPDQLPASAKQMLTYLLRNEGAVAELDRHHEARPSFNDHGQPTNDEATIQEQIADDFVADTTNVDQLLAIDRNWDASANGAQVFVQLFQPTDAKRDRLLLWDMFQTLIHEYIHTLRADPYDQYANSFGDSAERNTLIEGMDSVLDEIVWENVEPRVQTKDLRTKVEGGATAATPPISVPHSSQRRYDSYAEALKLVDLVGIRSVYAAYFLGLVDRIGGPAPAATP
jgi:hypothetical protein